MDSRHFSISQLVSGHRAHTEPQRPSGRVILSGLVVGVVDDDNDNDESYTLFVSHAQ